LAREVYQGVVSLSDSVGSGIEQYSPRVEELTLVSFEDVHFCRTPADVHEVPASVIWKAVLSERRGELCCGIEERPETLRQLGVDRLVLDVVQPTKFVETVRACPQPRIREVVMT